MLKKVKTILDIMHRIDKYENLYESGVIDPAKVTRIALENAASIAGMFLTTEAVVVEEKEDEPPMTLQQWVVAECQE